MRLDAARVQLSRLHVAVVRLVVAIERRQAVARARSRGRGCTRGLSWSAARASSRPASGSRRSSPRIARPRRGAASRGGRVDAHAIDVERLAQQSLFRILARTEPAAPGLRRSQCRNAPRRFAWYGKRGARQQSRVDQVFAIRANDLDGPGAQVTFEAHEVDWHGGGAAEALRRAIL